MTYLHCLPHSLFEHLFNFYYSNHKIAPGTYSSSKYTTGRVTGALETIGNVKITTVALYYNPGIATGIYFRSKNRHRVCDDFNNLAPHVHNPNFPWRVQDLTLESGGVDFVNE